MSELRQGDRIGGRYVLIERLGLGGMGEVWLAELEGAGAFRRRVVLKMLAPERGDPGRRGLPRRLWRGARCGQRRDRAAGRGAEGQTRVHGAGTGARREGRS